MNSFLQSASWLGTAELFNRVMRLGTTVIVSRALSPEDYGLSAIVLVVAEIAAVLSMRTGIGSKLVQAPQQDLEQLCQTAYGLNWVIAIGIFLIQFSIAFPIAHWYHDSRLIAPICILACNTLVAPTYLIQAALVYRENQFQVLALCNVVQAFFGNLAAIVLAQMGYGLWAFVVPGIIATPIWWFIIRRSQSWCFQGKISMARWPEILTFAKNLMGIELLGKLRANVDYLLIGQVLGMEALGIYYFAFNAGLGISMSLIQSLTHPLYSHLCDCQGDQTAIRSLYFSSLQSIGIIMGPFILLQTCLAPWYVPMVFGQKWIGAIPIVMLICLSAFPRAFADSASTLLQSIDRGKVDMYWNLIFTLIFSLALCVSVKSGITSVAITVLAVNFILIPFFMRWVHRLDVLSSNPTEVCS
jgi:O-antigen/teichoic acid export membrane protein